MAWDCLVHLSILICFYSIKYIKLESQPIIIHSISGLDACDTQGSAPASCELGWYYIAITIVHSMAEHF